MSHKGDWDRTSDRRKYSDNAAKILSTPSAGYCEHHIHREMECKRCENGSKK